MLLGGWSALRTGNKEANPAWDHVAREARFVFHSDGFAAFVKKVASRIALEGRQDCQFDPFMPAPRSSPQSNNSYHATVFKNGSRAVGYGSSMGPLPSSIASQWEGAATRSPPLYIDRYAQQPNPASCLVRFAIAALLASSPTISRCGLYLEVRVTTIGRIEPSDITNVNTKQYFVLNIARISPWIF